MLHGCSVVELRQYTLHDGTRERLIQLFEDEFIESQKALGITVVGPFRDLEDSNRFVWLRGFPNMNERNRMLSDFYGGSVWRAHCDAANATMIDSDNVLLLRPTVTNELEIGSFGRNALLVTNSHYVDGSAIKGFSQSFTETVNPVLAHSGAHMIALFETRLRRTLSRGFQLEKVRQF